MKNSAAKKRKQVPAGYLVEIAIWEVSNTSGGQGNTAGSFGSSYEPTRVHNMVPLPSWPNPYEV